MKCAVLTGMLLIAGCVVASGQCTTQPGFVCLSQTAANQARDNKLELDATKTEVIVLKGALTDKDKLLADVQKTARANEADLKAQNTTLLVQVADKSGSLGECRADKVMYQALIEYLTKNQRQKKIGLVNLF